MLILFEVNRFGKTETVKEKKRGNEHIHFWLKYCLINIINKIISSKLVEGLTPFLLANSLANYIALDPATSRAQNYKMPKTFYSLVSLDYFFF